MSFFQRYKLLLVNVSSASGLVTLGDYCVQKWYEKKEHLSKNRSLGAGITGGVMGIEGHIWYSFLDRLLAQATWRSVFKKVICDQIVAAPIYTSTYIIGTSILEGRTSLNKLTTDLKENLVPLYIADCAVFIPVQIINFRFVSAFYRVPFMYCVSFFFNVFLSAFKHRHEQNDQVKD